MTRSRISSRSLQVALLASTLLIAAFAMAAAEPERTIDWSKGSAQDTQANCGAFSFTNMQDKQSYSLYVRGKESATCSFQADGLRFHLPQNHGGTTASTSTIYQFRRFGSDVIVTWAPGY